MADDSSESSRRFLEPPTITALKQEARDASNSGPLPMIRSLSEDIREERKDLKEAAEQTLNIILDLTLDGRVNWVSPSWPEVVGTPIAEVEGKFIREIILDNKSAFEDAVESMKKDDSRSQIVRFAVKTGPSSIFRRERREELAAADESGESIQEAQEEENDDDVLNLEGQGIMVYDTPASGDGHTMWMLRPSSERREITIGLPPLVVESLGVGAEVLANYLTELAEAGISDPANHPPPTPVLCRICDRQITPWWFEKHSDLCLQEHRSEMDVQLAQDNLNEHRHSIVKVLDALEARKSRLGPDNTGPQAEYKGLPIGPSPSTSGIVSGSSSSSGTPPRSRDPSTSGLGHSRTRSSFAVRRPLARIVELVLDLCDTALEISTPALKESRTELSDEVRTQSPQSESRISQVMQWQSPSSNTLEQEQGLAALSADTEQLARAKVEAVFRHRRIVEYAERIRIEFAVLIEECIATAMEKAERVAAGNLDESSSASSTEEEKEVDTSEAPPAAPPQESLPSATSSIAIPSSDGAMERPVRPQLSRGSSIAISTRSSSPLECPTPRSHKSVGILGQTLLAKRGSLLAESDAAADSDSSMISSVLSNERQTESPSSERGLSRATSSRENKRRSLILPGMSNSPRRESPARNPPASPLRLGKPRLSMGGEIMQSPATSPILTSMELGPHNSSFYMPVNRHHHRRQSSTNSPELGKGPVSPHLSSVSQPPPRAVTPSIKDFEIIKPISKGAFGSVYLSKKKTTQEYFAIKVLKKADMVAKNQVTNVKAERAIMMWQGESDFVAKLYWTFASKDYLYLVMEYLNGGDCSTLVRQLEGLPEEWAMRYTAEVIFGVEHLHSRGIVHRDLKPDNLLIDARGHLKLTDFGLSRMGLVGRQKRIQKNPNESVPDLLKQGPFTRTTSMASSRSASFDFPGSQSPNTTPLIHPEMTGPGQPSYFSLAKDQNVNREPSRRASGYRSDSGGSDTLSAHFKSLNMFDTGDTPYSLHHTPQPQQGVSIEEESQSEASDSPQLFPTHPSTNYQPSFPISQSSTQQPQIPPAMALFNPDDQNHGFVGTPDYLAPETIQGVCQDEMCDWWSLGCILFEFIHGYPPFNAPTTDEVFQNILSRKINWPESFEEYSSEECRDLMNKLMTLDPEERLGSNSADKFSNGGAEIRAHSWFADLNWDALLEDDGSFVPTVMHPEDTEYFDLRGATMQGFTEEADDQLSSPPTSSGPYPDRPHDALFKAKSQVSSLKRGLIPLHIPPHIRDARSRRLSEPVLADDFGNFSFKNLPVLEKANKDVIQKMRQEAMQAQQRSVPSATTTPSTASAPSLEGSPMIAGPLKRTMSQNKAINRPSSPSSVSQTNSSPSRPSQPSSPLLVQFSTGNHHHHHHERRKTSGSSSTFSQQSFPSSLQTGSYEQPRMPASLKTAASTASSPVKNPKLPSPDKFASLHRQSSAPARQRSHTLGSQDSEAPLPREHFVPGHHKRRSQLFDVSPSSSDNEDPRAKALLKIQRRRQSSRRLSQINFAEGPFFRPLDVLICEDHPVSRLVMERLFEKLRCRTITAVNGTEAMRFALGEVQFDIIMTEFKLPKISGADLARMVRDTRSANTNTPIVAVTGYLKDFPETHHFDALVEKPPTLEKLIDVLSKFCQWKPPPSDEAAQHLQIPTATALRNIPLRLEDSPSSVSSGFAALPVSSYRGSSREESLGSSYFGDMDVSRPEDTSCPLVRQNTDEWSGSHSGGLGISEESPVVTRPTLGEARSPPLMSSLQKTFSAPDPYPGGPRTPRNPRSVECVRSKRESMEAKRYEGAESGDDEDEELGHVHNRSNRCLQNTGGGKQRRSGSKLGTEMMRTNSRGSVVSAGEDLSKEREPEALESLVGNKLAPSALSPGLDSGMDQVHLGEEVLEALPEVPEKEDSCTPSTVEVDEPSYGRHYDQPTGEKHLKIDTPQDIASSPSCPPSTDSQLRAPGETLETKPLQQNVTPPGTACGLTAVTPDTHRPGRLEDTETTPKASSKKDPQLSERNEESVEPTSHSSHRHKTHHTIERVVGWMRREGH